MKKDLKRVLFCVPKIPERTRKESKGIINKEGLLQTTAFLVATTNLLS